MKILKYKKTTNDRYKILLDDDRELLLYEDVILKFELLLKKEILEEDLMEIELFNQECDVYQVALQSIKQRFKSVYDTKEFLIKKQYPIEMIDKAISKLVEQGYLNDRGFAKSYINNQIITTNKGPFKIKSELSNHKVSDDIINEEIEAFDLDSQLLKIRKVADRIYKSNKSRGGAILKKKMVMDLINLGYDNSTISMVVDEYDFSNNKELVEKEYIKIKKRLEKKYSGKDLEYKIKEKLYQKGLYYED